MSTRANIIIKDSFNKPLYFYRHSDGYPEGAMPTLSLFIKWVKEGKIRNNTSQAAGWLTLIGHDEYAKEGHCGTIESMKTGIKNGDYDFAQWKVGAYEPTTAIHGDIEFLYEIDLSKKSLRCWKHNGEKKGQEVSLDNHMAA